MRRGANSRFALLAAIGCATLLNPLNSSMIAVALPWIAADFGVSFVGGSWLISTYYLASAIAQPLMGRLSDLYGRRRLFVAGIALVAFSSMLAPFSPAFAWLVLFRIAQALGSSAFYPIGTGIVRDEVPQRQAGALGVLAVFASTAAALGPSVGGFLVHYGGWPLIFFVNLPFLLLSFVLVLRVLPPDAVGDRGSRVPLDAAGMLLFAVTLASILFFLLSFEEQPNLLIGLLALGAGALFYQRERRAEAPFLDVRGFFSNARVLLVHAQYVLLNLIFYSVFFGIPAYLQEALRFDARVTGLLMLSIAGLGVAAIPLAGRITDSYGPRPALLISSVCALAGTLLLFTFGGSASAAWIASVLSLFGLASGFGNLALQVALLNLTPPAQTSGASGLFMSSRYLGTILSASLLGIAFGPTVDAAGLSVMAAVLSALAVLLPLLAALTDSPSWGSQDSGTAG